MMAILFRNTFNCLSLNRVHGGTEKSTFQTKQTIFNTQNSSTTHLQTLVVRLIYADKVWGLEILPHSKIPQWFIQVEGILSERKIIKTI